MDMLCLDVALGCFLLLCVVLIVWIFLGERRRG